MTINQSITLFIKITLLRFIHPQSHLVNSLRGIRNWFNVHFHTIEWELNQANMSYSTWIEIYESPSSSKTTLDLLPHLTVSVLVSKPKNLDQLLRLVQSLNTQIHPNWELIIGSDELWISQIAMIDSRIKCVKGEVIDYMALATHATGEFVVCAQDSDQFSSCFLTLCLAKVRQYPNVQIIYSDNDWISENGERIEPFFKPDTCSLEMLYSVNYLSRAMLHRELVLSIEELLPIGRDEPDVLEWNIILNCISLSQKTIHVPNILVHQQSSLKKETQIQTTLMLEHYLKQLGLHQPHATSTSDGWRVTWHSKQPLVSIVIPSKNNHLVFKYCLDSIFRLTNYKNYELIVVDNNSTDKNLLAFYEDMRENSKIKIIEYNESFNYSHAINLGAAEAKGDLLLFLNNDTQVLNEDWLDELVRWALVPEIGIVGGKLLYPDGRIQHAGVILGLEGFVDHLYMNAPHNYHGLIGSVNWYRNVSAVTGACQMMRHTVFNELGGYDESYHLIFSDIDICLKAIKKSYRILYTPFARLTHHHGLSRNRKDPIRDLALGFKHLLSNFDGNDPFFSPNLTYSYIPRCQIKFESGNERIQRMREKQAIFERWKDK